MKNNGDIRKNNGDICKNNGDSRFLIDLNLYSRCDLEQKDRPPIFKQLMANDEKKKARKDGKMSEKLTDKLIKNLRYVLVEKDDFAEKLCMLGTTSACESNHARIVNRGFYTKGEAFFDLEMTLK